MKSKLFFIFNISIMSGQQPFIYLIKQRKGSSSPIQCTSRGSNCTENIYSIWITQDLE